MSDIRVSASTSIRGCEVLPIQNRAPYPAPRPSSPLLRLAVAARSSYPHPTHLHQRTRVVRSVSYTHILLVSNRVLCVRVCASAYPYVPGRACLFVCLFPSPFAFVVGSFWNWCLIFVWKKKVHHTAYCCCVQRHYARLVRQHRPIDHQAEHSHCTGPGFAHNQPNVIYGVLDG